MARAAAFDEIPFSAFHWRVAIASTGGVFSDGFGLGIIGIAVSQGAQQLRLTPWWIGLLGAASLAGLFLGALVAGPVADRAGRRPVFASNMAALALCSALQYFVASGGQLLALRVVIGLLLGTDYVVSKALLTEFAPRRARGRVLGVLSVAWAGGYACAYAAGFALLASPGEPWRWMLLASAVPCALILPLRWFIPESPRWLMARGRSAEAARVTREAFGAGVDPPLLGAVPPADGSRWRELGSAPWRRRTLVGCVFFTAQVIPYFAVGTFISRVLDALHVAGGYAGGLAYNGALLAGAAAGMAVVDRLPRRVFLVGSFALAAASLAPLALSNELPSALVVVLFAVFAGVVSAASNLVYVYLPELFPTHLRASGIGLAVAASRIGSAVSTFLLPVVVHDYGARAALAVCVLVLLAGAMVCFAWAPETRDRPIDEQLRA
ncbi:MAG: MFS transporter [Proteobacteria bacterium]|nr:MFS transporter [Pseudomonadota bacterium]